MKTLKIPIKPIQNPPPPKKKHNFNINDFLTASRIGIYWKRTSERKSLFSDEFNNYDINN